MVSSASAAALGAASSSAATGPSTGSAPGPAACSALLAKSRSRRRPAWTAASWARRCSASQASTDWNRSVSNSRRSSLPRSSESARRKRAKSPCGSSTTWQNWSRLIPISRWISSPASWCDLLTARQPGPAAPVPAPSADHSRNRVWARSTVMPVPTFFGRGCSGIRTISSRRPPSVSSSRTSVSRSGSAWSLRSRLARRVPGTSP